MFFHVGIGERAGSGLPKVFESWKGYHWKKPMLEELIEPSEQTRLSLWMTDLFPQGSMTLLARYFGDDFTNASHLVQLAMGIALNEKTLTHERLGTLSTEHSADVSKVLTMLVNKGWLKQTGHSRGSVYHLSTLDGLLPKADDIFCGTNTLGLGSNTLGLDSNTLGLDENRDELGRFISPDSFHQHPFVDNLNYLSKSALNTLYNIAKDPRNKQRMPTKNMEQVILKLCQNQYLSISVLSELVMRSQDLLRKSYLSKMVKSQKLQLAFPTETSSPKQAYITILYKI